MAFNIMARNLDDHTKNFSFLYRKGCSWELSPAYDINFSNHPVSSRKHQHFIAVNCRHNGITRHDLLQEAERFSVGGAKTILAEIRATVEQWGEFAKEAGIPSQKVDEICKEHHDQSADRYPSTNALTGQTRSEIKA